MEQLRQRKLLIMLSDNLAKYANIILYFSKLLMLFFELLGCCFDMGVDYGTHSF